jgi:precorrin-6Y C5,15-methyltransferase (decarboxylating)/precorrin-6A/cobalt-precorrin-6A reductase
MQGPFSRELNRALLRQFGITIMVTKDGGAEGGFPEKMLAAEDAGVRAFVIGRPGGDEGLGMEEILAAVAARLEERR